MDRFSILKEGKVGGGLVDIEPKRILRRGLCFSQKNNNALLSVLNIGKTRNYPGI